MRWTPDRKIVDFAPTDDMKLIVDWDDGSRRVFDMDVMGKRGVFRQLYNDASYFNKAYSAVNGTTIQWPDGQDIAPETLYEQSTVVDKQSTPLPPRRSNMVWDPSKTIASIEPHENGLLDIEWSDGTTREFSVWANVAANSIERLENSAYLLQAKVSKGRNGVEWPEGDRYDAKTLYEHAAIVSDGGSRSEA